MSKGGELPRPKPTSSTSDDVEKTKEIIKDSSGTITIAEETIKDIQDKGIFDAMIGFVKKVGNTLLMKTAEGVVKATEKELEEVMKEQFGGEKRKKTKKMVLKKIMKAFQKGGALPRPKPTSSPQDEDKKELIDTIKNLPEGSTIELTESEVNALANDKDTANALMDIAKKAGITILTVVAGKVVQMGSEMILDFLKGVFEKGLLELARFLFTGGKQHYDEMDGGLIPRLTKSLIKKVIKKIKDKKGGAEEEEPKKVEEPKKEEPKEMVVKEVEVGEEPLSDEIEQMPHASLVKGVLMKKQQIPNIKTSGSMNDRLKTMFYSKRK